MMVLRVSGAMIPRASSPIPVYVRHCRIETILTARNGGREAAAAGFLFQGLAPEG